MKKGGRIYRKKDDHMTTRQSNFKNFLFLFIYLYFFTCSKDYYETPLAGPETLVVVAKSLP